MLSLLRVLDVRLLGSRCRPHLIAPFDVTCFVQNWTLGFHVVDMVKSLRGGKNGGFVFLFLFQLVIQRIMFLTCRRTECHCMNA